MQVEELVEKFRGAILEVPLKAANPDHCDSLATVNSQSFCKVLSCRVRFAVIGGALRLKRCRRPDFLLVEVS